jgi:hypothetical protein
MINNTNKFTNEIFRTIFFSRNTVIVSNNNKE